MPEDDAIEPHPFDTAARSISRTALDDARILSGQYWGELRTFLAVAKAKSLSGAAVEIGSSHATVGREIRRLQDIMGAQLVVLTKKSGAKLTDKGKQLAERLLRFDQQLFALAGELRTEASMTEGMVRLGVTDGLGVVFVVPALRQFATQFPRVHVELKSPGNFKNLRENQTDIMVGFSPDPSQDLTCRPLGWLHFIPIASRLYVERRGVPGLSNIGDHTFIDSEIYSARGGPWDNWHRLVERGNNAFSCDASITYGMMVKAGLGIGLLGNYNLMEPAAVPVDLNLQVSLRLYAVALTERLTAKPVRVVFDMIERLFGEGNPWFAREMATKVEAPEFREGYAALFNL